MQRLVTDKSSAFRSHPLFPLLRDLIIADMNFHEPSFPHSLIRDLPSDFNKLLTVSKNAAIRRMLLDIIMELLYTSTTTIFILILVYNNSGYTIR